MRSWSRSYSTIALLIATAVAGPAAAAGLTTPLDALPLTVLAAASPIRPLVPQPLERRGVSDSAAIVAWADLEPVPAPTPRLAEPPAPNAAKGLMRPDRLRHASLSLTLGLAAGLMTREPWASLATGAAVGFGKEAWDARTHEFDLVDLCAGMLGAAIAASATAAIVR